MPKHPHGTDAADFADRLRAAIQHAGQNAGHGAGAELARRHKVAVVTANAWLKGEHMPSPSKVEAMAADYGVRYEWLYFGTGTMTAEPAVATSPLSLLRPIRTWNSVEDLPADEYVVVPRMTLRLSAGNGGPVAEPDPQLDQGQAFRTAYIRRRRLKPRALMSAYAQGDSMEPRICDGDALLIDTSQTDIQDGKIYAVVWNDNEELRVKRLYKLPGGSILIKSDNRDRYPEIAVPADQVGTVTVLGRVVLVSGDV